MRQDADGEDEAGRLLDRLEAGEWRDLDEADRVALDEADRGLRLLEEAGPVPDPGPLYWRRFGARVQEALPPRRRAVPGPGWVAAAAAVLAVSVTLSRAPGPTSESGWRALPEDDAALLVLAGLGEEAQALEPEAACAMEECVLELDEVQSRRLASLLREELEGREM